MITSMRKNIDTVPSPRPYSITGPTTNTTTSSSTSTTTTTNTNTNTNTGRTRRLSLNIPNPSPRSIPVPVPVRHGSISHSNSISHRHRTNASGSLSTSAGRSSLSLSLPRGHVEEGPLSDDGWLSVSVGDIDTEGEGEVVCVSGEEGMERAVEVLLASRTTCLLVHLSKGDYAFFDFTDLNAFLLLVLQAASDAGPDAEMGERKREIVRLLRAGAKVHVSSVCNISDKNPCHSFDPRTTTLRDLVPLLASGVHRVLLLPSPNSSSQDGQQGQPTIMTASQTLQHLVTSRPPPAFFHRTFFSTSLDMPLNPLVSLPGQNSVLDAMQVMSLNGLSALGVLGSGIGGGVGHHRRGSSSSGSSYSFTQSASATGSGTSKRSNSSTLPRPSSITNFTLSPSIQAYSPGTELPSPFESSAAGDLFNVITAEGCARLVVPSQGRQVLGMGLGEAAKALQVVEEAGQERGEERVPVHTITAHSSILHASHLILATSSSRVFLRTPQSGGLGQSPGISPISPSPSMSSLSLEPASSSGASGTRQAGGRSGLPTPPPTTFSPHYVVSITDILASLIRAYRHEIPSNAAKLEQASLLGIDSEGGKGKVYDTTGGQTLDEGGRGGGLGLGLDSWKWAKGDDDLRI